MRYYKTNTDGIISLSTLDADGEGNISEEEYNTLVTLLKEMPSGKLLTEVDGQYAYVNAPSTDELEDAEALAIILGGDSE